MITITLDTDIGTDPDDLLALAVILGSPQVSLQAVTTVYGDTALRARMVHRAYALAGRPAPPIAAGAREPRSGRAVWWAGHEGALMSGLDREPFDESLKVTPLLRASGIIAAVGPLTNVADALDGPDVIQQLVIMGGDFGSETPEHNLKCDVTAAQAVFEAGIPALVTGIDQTDRVVLAQGQIEIIEASGPLGALLAAEIHQFRNWLGRPDSPHDAVAVLAKLRPELFTFATGTVRVDSAGNTSLLRHDDGPHQVVTDLDPGAVAHDLVSRIRRAAAALR
jgi:purine nucleosidase